MKPGRVERSEMKSKTCSREASTSVLREIGPIAAVILFLEMLDFPYQASKLASTICSSAGTIVSQSPDGQSRTEPRLAMIGQGQADLRHAGETAGGAGSFECVGCAFPVSLEPAEAIPECPNCGGADFRRASMFEQPTLRNITIARPS